MNSGLWEFGHRALKAYWDISGTPTRVSAHAGSAAACLPHAGGVLGY